MNASLLLPGDLTLSLMDTAFSLEGEERSRFLQMLMQSFGCRYICLWSFLVPSSYFQCLEGYYQDDADNFQAASSSSGSLAQRFFNEYKQSPIFIQETNRHNNVPGFAFSTQTPYIELGLEHLMRFSSNISQRQFYQEARIKTAVFMGCRSGEIELGFSNVSHVDIEMQMKNLFPEDFSRQLIPVELPRTTDQQNPPSSSSSSLRSLSIDSPAECSSLLFNIPVTSYNIPEPQLRGTVSPIDQASHAIATTIATTTTTTITSTPHQALPHIQGLRFPIPESEHAAMTNAFLAVLSSPSSSTTSPQQRQQQTINFANIFRENYPGASPSSFRNYSSALVATSSQTKANVRRHNIIRRIIAHCRSLHSIRRQEQLQMSGRHTSNQLHHMMSERKRREKLNESFQALKSLLPPGTKKDKASVLASTREYLSSLKAQVNELRRKNAILEAQVLPKDQATKEASSSTFTTNGGNNLDVHIRPVGESTSQDQSTEARIVDLQVSVRGDVSISQLVIRLLEFLKQVNNVNLMSMEADARVEESNVVNRLTLRLRVEGIEWDESAFQEAVRRVVADMAPPSKDKV